MNNTGKSTKPTIVSTAFIFCDGVQVERKYESTRWLCLNLTVVMIMKSRVLSSRLKSRYHIQASMLFDLIPVSTLRRCNEWVIHGYWTFNNTWRSAIIGLIAPYSTMCHVSACRSNININMFPAQTISQNIIWTQIYIGRIFLFIYTYLITLNFLALAFLKTNLNL